MLVHQPSPRAHRSARAALAALLLASAAFIAGCAVPGPPVARHPITPEAVRDLAAHQLGDSVVLDFSLPSQSTDQEPLPSAPSVEIYRSSPAPTAPGVTYAPSARPAGRLTSSIAAGALDPYRKDSHIEIPAPLDPAALAKSPGEQQIFTVRTRVSEKRASLDSNPVTLRLYPPPQPVGAVRAAVAEDAIELSWSAVPERTASGAPVLGYRIYRSEVAPPGAPPSGAAPAAAPSGSLALPFAASSRLPTAPELITPMPLPLSQTSYRDTGIELDHAYSYVLRSVAQAGAEMLESADSQPLIVYAKDVFPPAAPGGLEAVIVPPTAGAPGYVELAWAISPELDLAGYYVYRSEQPGAPGARLNAEPAPAPTYRDDAVVAGRRYYYRVSAVDRAGNESGRSAEIEAEVAGNQP